MKIVMLMFDSLNRRLLQPYNHDTKVKTPNFQRLADKSVTFNSSYVCSMPCMPARRDFHTGRPNFLHNSWGPLEPFDDSAVQMLGEAGIHTHLASDHYHYWEDGGATYHNRYTTWQSFRGQEGDPCIGKVGAIDMPEIMGKVAAKTTEMRDRAKQDQLNRNAVENGQCKHSQRQTIDAGLEFIDDNAKDDNWFVQIECFDPHEPFFSEQDYQDQYPTDYDGPRFDWPNYGEVTETEQQIEEARRNNAALTTQCDASLGRVLDAMDKYELWEDTMLIVWTDHGFMLGEHNMWAKNVMPLYQEIVNTPFFVWDPRCKNKGETRNALIQPAIDLGPTILDFFGLQIAKDMTGKNLAGTIKDDSPVREAAIFGYHGRAVNVTDGRFMYMRNAQENNNAPLYSYTLMPTKMRGFKITPPNAKADTELAKWGLGGDTTSPDGMELAGPFSFTKGQRVLRLGPLSHPVPHETTLWDLQKDPHQEAPINDSAIEQTMVNHLTKLMREADAPKEQYERLGVLNYEL